MCVCVCERAHRTHPPKVPEEEVANLAVGLGALQQETCEGAVVVRLVAQHLHQLQQVLGQLLVTVGGVHTHTHTKRDRERYK